MKILICLPVYNEELVLEKNTKTVFDFCQQNIGQQDCQIIIADNNSNDNTAQIGKDLAQQYEQVEYIYIAQKGKGIAWRTAFMKFEADCYIVMDADLAVELSAVIDVIKNIENGADLVVGSRYLAESKIKRSFFRDLFSIAYRHLARIILQTKISDFQCGFKGINNKIKANILPRTEDTGFFLDTEIIILAEKAGYNVKEVPVDWVESRDEDRKSTVNVLETSFDYLKKIWGLRKKAKKITKERF